MILRLRLCPVLLFVFAGGCTPSSTQSAHSGNNAGPTAAATAADLPVGNAAVAVAPPRASVSLTVEPANDASAAVGSADDALDLPPSKDAAQPTPFPDEVTTYMVDRDGCDHFRGEEPYDAERRAFLDENIAELCTGTDAKLVTLRRRYAQDSAVIAALSGYEDRIERDRED